jgi:epoxyqueuosine reductase
MSGFHSTVSRREFMKALGLAGAGVGGAALVAPAFHDLDEAISSTTANPGRPWWVKEADKPTIEIDWSMMNRHDGRLQGQSNYTKAFYYGKDRTLNTANVGQVILDAHTKNLDPGFTLRAQALNGAWRNVGRTAGDFGWAGEKDTSPAKTPEQRGVPKWTGTPEEASKMLRAAMRVYGASLLGFLEVGENERKHVFLSVGEKANETTWIDSWPPPPTAARPIVYEDVDKAYSTTTKLVVPNKQLWEVSVSCQGANELWRTAPTPLANLANSNTFANVGNLNASTYGFLRMLGYQQIAIIGNDGLYLDGGGPPAIMSGVGEASRQKLYTLTPEYGAPGRLYSIGTDLPLEPSKPIDAGMYRFCHSCHKCADHCPPGVISQAKDSSWELPQTAGKETIYSVKGTKAFYSDFCMCNIYTSEAGGCKLCWANCTFTVNHGSMAHQLVKSTIANTSIFNSFFYKMGESFGYGNGVDKAETWWDQNLPVLGQDFNAVSSTGGYR